MDTSPSLDDESEMGNLFKSCTSLTVDEFSDVCDKFQPSDFTSLHLNIRGCRTNFNEFASIFSSMSFSF